MSTPFELVVCITSTALFDCNESHKIWEREGLEAYQEHQHARVIIPMKPGVGFPLVQSLLELNKIAGKHLVEVILVSRNDGDSGERVRHSITHYKLPITRMSFTAGTDVTKYLPAWKCDLFLSTEEDQVRTVLTSTNGNIFEGIAAALVCSIRDETITTELNCSTDDETMAVHNLPEFVSLPQWPEGQVRIVFDGDGVLFSDEAEHIFHTQGLTAFNQSEQEKGHIPLPKGPMQAFALKLQKVRRALEDVNSWRVRTFLVTARDREAIKRVYRTLQEWDLEIDEKHFLGGLDKTPILRAIDPAIYFDDSTDHIQRAKQHVPAAHVVYGAKNIQASSYTIESKTRTTVPEDENARCNRTEQQALKTTH
ncbi:unnamed protein product [Rotaria socialis]|uniref:5'-nucleotidase n=1 Tax=Rotaria socialis TaxID=392032 RepID=A0A820ZUI9_9BILA|nr:unnamed protein product [Rotaria socialis]CAF3395762.1 unnamed protein product [Rotaria socialis]CAF4340577.1 unnamed protein product [Rotaria socialis]CAF4570479.1 unnamed protein product [Rotaria socialis]